MGNELVEKSKRALITGVTGQDGSYLSELLLEKGYSVVGVKRRSSTNNLERLSGCIGHRNFHIVEGEISDSGCVHDLISTHQPDEVYNLAAQSHVGTSFKQPDFTFQVNALGALYFLQAIYKQSPNTKFYQASTSEMFGNNYDELGDFFDDRVYERYQDEDTPFMPQSPYAIAKTAAHHTVRIYREAHNIFGCCGILFNHESERRGEEFVTRKITKWIGEFIGWMHTHNLSYSDLKLEEDINGRALIYTKEKISTFPRLRLGNLDAYRDWGHAKDYVEAMYLMMQQENPDDYVIATGESHTIREFLNEAFQCVDIWDWSPYVMIDPEFYRPSEVDFLKGSPKKALTKLGWVPQIHFSELVNSMVESDVHDISEKLA